LKKPPTKATPADLEQLGTERTNPSSAELDRMSSLEIAELINREDFKVAAAVQRAVPQIARAIDMTAEGLRNGGRLIYVGAGTSGRIAALDATECPPTFNVKPGLVQFLIAGGKQALAGAVEASEDSTELGRRQMATLHPGVNDVVVGIAASGRTPFTLAAIEYARRRKAKTIAVVCNRNSPLEKAAHLAIVTEVGPEVLAGSSRMKAGSAQKMVLNILSTGTMSRLGYIYGNLMVNLHLKNSKLRERGIRIVELAAGVDRATAVNAVHRAGKSVPVAIVMLLAEVSRATAEHALKASDWNVRKAVARVQGSN
jgi:N-acetylmuramic acid 6-phosphate etherase